MPFQFTDRTDAGRRLGARLRPSYGGRSDLVVIGLPRGGVPVAAEVAACLAAPASALGVRKIRLPGQPELALGATADGGDVVWNPEVVARSGLDHEELNLLADRERRTLDRRYVRPRDLAGRCVILVDDGLATGASMRAAVDVLRASVSAVRLVVAVPVSAAPSLDLLRPLVEDVVCLLTLRHFVSVSQSYLDFGQVEDAEVSRLLAESSSPPADSPSG